MSDTGKVKTSDRSRNTRLAKIAAILAIGGSLSGCETIFPLDPDYRYRYQTTAWSQRACALESSAQARYRDESRYSWW